MLKNMTRTAFAVLVLSAVTVCMIGCDDKNRENGTATAYSILNDGLYVLEGDVTLVDGEATDCRISEYNTMMMWAGVSERTLTEEEMALLGDESVTTALFQGHGEPAQARYATYVQVGDTVFSAVPDEGGFIGYVSDATGPFVSWLQAGEENIAWYIVQMEKGNYWILIKTESGYRKLDPVSFYRDASGNPLEKGQSQNKRYSRHWSGWLPNIEKIEQFFVTNGFTGGSFRKGEDGVWRVADAISGATIAEFEGYAHILYRAYAKNNPDILHYFAGLNPPW